MRHNRVAEIDGIRITQLKSVTDARGAFVKFHPLKDLESPLGSVALSINPNLGTVRGMHFQIEPFAEEKLVTCIQGSIFDVFVDLRPNSKTFGEWSSIELSAANALQAYLPKGIAHGFQTLMPNSIINYSLTSTYAPEYSYSIDPFGDLGIEWPIEVHLVSERDAGGISLSSAGEKYADSIKN